MAVGSMGNGQAAAGQTAKVEQVAIGSEHCIGWLELVTGAVSKFRANSSSPARWYEGVW